MSSDPEQHWYGVRCVFRHPAETLKSLEGQGDLDVFEERVTLWRASSFEAAILKAEEEGTEYASMVDCEPTGLSQAYLLDDDLGEGAEVFSLMRKSSLTTPDYLDRYFDDGSEFQGDALN